MKSHSQIPTSDPKALARKINRGGVGRLLPQELKVIGEDVGAVASLCTLGRAIEVFNYFGESMPEGFQTTPVTGEKDSYIERLKRSHDQVYKAG